MLGQIENELTLLSNPEKAKKLSSFFKTGKGEYGEGDVFIGIRVPILRGIVKNYYDLSLPKIQELLKSDIHEHRLGGLFILNHKYQKASDEDKANIFNFYLNNTKNINNWDLVDLSAPNIVGDFLFDKDKKVLYGLANSNDLWKKRIAVVSTFSFIRKNEFEDILAISELLLKDKHDLIHKAVGWMLREVGKREKNILKDFLKEHYENIPRTTLRYAIEKFEEDERKKWLRGELD